MEPSTSQQCSILVEGLPNDATKDLVLNYFENKRRSKGDAIRVAEHSPHNLSGACLSVSLIKEFEKEEEDHSIEENTEEVEDNLTIIVSGLKSTTTKDTVLYYFENSRRSGGGEVLNVDFKEQGDAVVTFQEVKDSKRLLESSHRIDETPIEVRVQPPKKKVPPDPVMVHVQGLNLEKTSKDCLELYLEKFSDVEVKAIQFGSNDNALAVFDSEPGVEGRRLRLERVPVCTCVQVTGLSERSSNDTIDFYFDNERRSGGKDVVKVERLWKDEALVSFEDPSSVQNAIRRRHVLEGNKLDVKAYYPFLQDTTPKKTEIPIDRDVLEFIKRNYVSELEEVSHELKIEIEDSKDSHSQAIICVSAVDNRKNSIPSLEERVAQLTHFLHDFTKAGLKIASEIFDEITKRWEAQGPLVASRDFQISLDSHQRRAEIIGKTLCVDAEMKKMDDLVKAVQEDTKLMKTVVEVVEDSFPAPKLHLLEASGICETLGDDQRHVAISVDSVQKRLKMKGPRCLLQEVKIEVFNFISKMVDKTIELSGKVVTVLKRPQVLEFMHDLFTQNDIRAVLLFDQSQRSNEITVVGVDSTTARDAEMLLQDTVQEMSLHLTPENAALLQGSLWRDFQSSIASNFKVQVTEDLSHSTIWVCGITNSVNECFGKITDFFERNTILCKVIPAERGVIIFVSEVWKTKLEEIKGELSKFSIGINVNPNREGVEVSGTTERLKRCLPKVRELLDAIQKRFVEIDKPGMKKFFKNEKGRSMLKATGEKNRCIILPKEDHKVENEADELEEEEDFRSSQELICSYVTKGGKKISVFKGDITKENVDVIVNAANNDLKHIGGLAAAILRAGGQQIQDECDNYVKNNGSVLEGHVMVSTPGRLACKKVVHAVRPIWDFKAKRLADEGEETKQERFLKYAVANSLKEAMTCRSVAIPAISSGVFGFPRDLCAKVILDAVLDFCVKTPMCTLSDIRLINIDSPTVQAFEEEMKTRFGAEKNFKEREGHTPEPAFAVGPKRHAFGMLETKSQYLVTPQNVRITVKPGNLAKEQADIIVGTAASNLNLNQNPCARALRDAAGPSLQMECSTIGQVAAGDIAVINSPGNLRCKAVIFAVCCEWDNGGARQVLKDLLQKCLQTASAQGAGSIAFPSIGTGTLQFPPVEVAKIYFDEVILFSQRNPQTTIKDVGFVPYDQDAPTVKAFDGEMKARLPGKTHRPVKESNQFAGSHMRGRKPVKSPTSRTAAFSLRERDQDHLEANVGSLCFQAYPGDITDQTTEAIVVISNEELDVGRSQAGAAILGKGGQSIKKECAKVGRQPPGSVVITEAGNLNARCILHIVPFKPMNVKASVVECLRKAEKEKIASIAFPVIGSGNIGMTAKKSAEVMLSAIHDFSDQKPKFLPIVRMVIFQKEMMKDIRSAIEEASGIIPQEKPGFFKRVTDYLGFTGASNKAPEEMNFVDDASLELVIFAGCQKDLNTAVNDINEIMCDKSTKQVIDRHAITKLSLEHSRRIHAIELRYDVKASVESTVGRIVINGQTEDILNATGEIHKLLDQVKEEEEELKTAEALSKVTQWMFKNYDKDSFQPFEPLVNAKIEAAYNKNKPAVDIADGSCRVDFKTMVMEEIQGSGVTEVQRENHTDLLPKHWTPQPKDQNGFERKVHLYELDPAKDSKEFQKVQDAFKVSCPSNNIVKIERVQNPALYATYAIRKKKMDEGNGSKEMSLFHGTAGESCKMINHTGFNRGFHGKNATAFGNGVYFALQAAYSARSTYSPPDANGNRHIYLTKVLVGEYTKGRQGLITPPPKDPNDPTDLYDSVVDDAQNPQIFVVFYDWQCYPEYLITFQ
ncbi:Protein mono-ADP-ribosyltransferase PARP14 [Acropora cervicornis]|uniref:Poly [ADP-ribose] polymerase n=1 Tax=Acropora cervicornis TaxID=6130 RepID=A0AAD9Q412_ACRCE|nr:Protein mono-ADP-ribosyltransferase PARP14 [Acropora cervicornis]